MSYFSYFPNVYVGKGVEDEDQLNFVLVKNIFRRVTIREDKEKYVTFFEQYEIGEGESPASLAYRLYGDATLDWIVLIANNITDFYAQWPKTESDLQKYVTDEYDDPDSIHHYETNEIKFEGEIFMKRGTEVNSDYQVVLPNGDVVPTSQAIYPVTNYEHETFLNEKKRIVTLPVPAILDAMVAEFEDLMEYKDNDEIDEKGNKKTPQSIVGRFLVGIISPANLSSNTQSRIGAVTQFDYGPTSNVGGGTTTTEVASSTTVTTATTGATVSTTSSGSSSGGSSSGSSGGY